MAEESERFISNITWRHIFTYYSGRESLLRLYQTEFIARHGRTVTGHVVELGGDRSQKHATFFPNASSFLCTNIDGDFDEYRDITGMKGVADESQDAYLCVSVVEHVRNLMKALAEIDRTLKVGGHLIMVAPFAFSRHGEIDFWRVGRDAYTALFPNYDFVEMAQLGGVYSTCADAFQRPRAKLTKRYLFNKTIGVMIALAGRFLDVPDGFALGYGVHAIKRAGQSAPTTA